MFRSHLTNSGIELAICDCGEISPLFATLSAYHLAGRTHYARLREWRAQHEEAHDAR